ncbi:multidrug effflux MFS transporter [Pseudaquabacterium rugosum]|uniref:Bcr/CflA family efflux transporter n=1 Tax=Pseudaquabacterium rugosum TaxID=2984194 RepID=A0ABU9BBE2_9BURK
MPPPASTSRLDPSAAAEPPDASAQAQAQAQAQVQSPAPPPAVSARTLLLVLALLSVFPPLATDMYLSAFGEIQHHLRAPDGALELSLSVFFLGLGVGQLLFGPLADRVGRKGPLLAGTALFCLCTVGLLWVQDVHAFIALRFVQALGACAGMVIGRAIVTDLHAGSQAARTMTLLALLMTLGPVLAPLAGGLLVSAFDWRAIFLAMLGVGLLALGLAWRALPETLPPGQRTRTPLHHMLGDYRALLRRPAFVVPALTGALALTGLFAFITASSHVLQDVMGLGRIAYGLTFGAIALGMGVASAVNHRLLARHTPRRIFQRALPLQTLSALGLLAVSGTTQLAVLLPPLWLTVALSGLLAANGQALTMEAARGHGGAGSALLGALQFGIAFISAALVAALVGEGRGALPLALGMAVPSVLALGLWWGAPGGGRGGPRPADRAAV